MLKFFEYFGKISAFSSYLIVGDLHNFNEYLAKIIINRQKTFFSCKRLTFLVNIVTKWIFFKMYLEETLILKYASRKKTFWDSE